MKTKLILITLAYVSLAFSTITSDDTLNQLGYQNLMLSEKISALEIEQEVVEIVCKEIKTNESRHLPTSKETSDLNFKNQAKWQELNFLKIQNRVAHFNLNLNQEHIKIREYLLIIREDQGLISVMKDSILNLLEINLNSIYSQKIYHEQQIKELKLILEDSTTSLSITDTTVSSWENFKNSQINSNLIFQSNQIQFLSKTAAQLDDYLIQIENISLGAHHSNPSFSTLSKVKRIWNFEISRSEGKPLTLGKLLLAILISLIGLKIAKKFSFLTSSLIQKRFRVDRGVADSTQKLLFYFFTVLFVLYALYLVRFPLTAFTFAGGAIAIGVGFGSQTLMNNFISGLILLIERPVKIGDFIEVEDIIGTVESIGLRSTLVRTPGNVHLVIPNSSFLEKKVTNWTHSDRIVRLEMSVGVAYGSDVIKVKSILEKIPLGVHKVQAYPAPVVIFQDFGDNALNFELIFWIHLEQLIQRRVIASDLRFKIEKAFNEAGIIIAYPQRDLHIDFSKPIDINLNNK